MAIEVLRGRKLEAEPKQFITKPQPESAFDTLKRVGTATGLGALRNLEGLANLVTLPIQHVGGYPKLNPLSQQIEQEYGITPGQQEPQNLLERFAQRFGSQAPLAALGGLPGLGGAALGSGAAALAGQAGLPEGIQDLAQLGTSIGSGLIKGKIPTIGKSQKAQYELARAAVKPETQAVAKPILSAMANVEKQLGTEVNESISNKVNHALQIIDKNISKEKINPKTAMDLRRNLYKLGNSLSKSDAKNYIEPLTKGVNEFFAGYAAENPTFYKHLSKADKFTELKNMTSVFDKVGNLAVKIPGGGPLINNIIKYTLGNTLGKTEKVLRSIATKPTAREHYFDAVKAIYKEDPSALIKAMTNLRGALPENLIEELPDKTKTSLAPKIEILRGKKLK